MTVIEAQAPIHQVSCNHHGCEATFTPSSKFDRRHASAARAEASEAGWDVPPFRGAGSRSQEDYCPDHRQRS